MRTFPGSPASPTIVILAGRNTWTTAVLVIR